MKTVKYVSTINNIDFLIYFQTGGRKRGAWAGRAVGRGGASSQAAAGGNRRGAGHHQDRRAEPAERRRRASLFRRISSKRASAEMQQVINWLTFSSRGR